MAPTIELLAEHGGMLLLGSTGLLAAGTLVVLACRAPVDRQRLGELALGATLAWLILAVIPLPRLVHVDGSREGEAPAEPRTTPSRSDPPAQLPLETRLSVGLPAQQELRPPGSRQRAVRPSEPRQEEVAPSIELIPLATTDHGAWRRILAAVYLWGVAVHLVWLAMGRILLAVTERLGAKPEPWLAELYRSLPAAARSTRARVLVSRWCRRPVVYGLWRPTILLPARLCCQRRAESLRCALLHELAHVARRDAWGNLLFNLACPFLYFHPLYWRLRRDVRFSRELIADDWAARFSANQSYAGHLLQLAADTGGIRLGVLGVLGVFRRQTPFYRRMSMLIDRKKRLAIRESRTCRWLGLLGCGVIAGVMVCCLGIRDAPAEAAESPDQAAESPHQSDPVGVETKETPEQPPEETHEAKRRAYLQDLTEKIQDVLSSVPGAKVRAMETLFPVPGRSALEGVLVSVEVPRRYAEDVWRRENPGSEPGEMKTPLEDEMLRLHSTLEARIKALLIPLVPEAPEAVGIDRARLVRFRWSDADLPGEITIRNCWLVLTTDIGVPARTEGTLVELSVQPGSKVKKGDLLARIDDEIPRLNLQEAKTLLGRTASNDVSIKYAEKACKVAEYEYQEAAAVNKNAPGAISTLELQRLALQMEQGRLQLEQAVNERELNRDAYASKVAIAEAQLARHRILAPVDGVVMETHTRVGRWVKLGDPVCRIVDLQRLCIKGHADATRNTPDDFTNREVTVQIILSNGRLQRTAGRITFVSPVIETGGRFEVHAEIDNTSKNGHWLFRPGMQATIVLEETPADE